MKIGWKPRIKRRNAGVVFALAMLIAFFQNCGGDFKSNQMSLNSASSLGTLSGTSTPVITPFPSVLIPTPTPAPTAVPTVEPTAFPTTGATSEPTPNQSLKPVIQSAGLGCDQNQCIWAMGLNFEAGCSVNLYDPAWVVTSPLATLKPANCSAGGLTFEIPDSVRSQYKQILMNVTSADGTKWSDSVAIVIARIAESSSLSSDVSVQGKDQVLVQQNVQNLDVSSKQVLITSDGRFFPTSLGTAIMRLRVDGSDVGNASIIDWSQSIHAAQHTFNVIATVLLAPGAHTVQLVGSTTDGKGAFVVGQGSNLWTFESSAKRIQTSTGVSDFGPYSSSASAPPVFPMLKFPNSVNGPAALLFSGRVYQGERGGDAMVGISTDGSSCPTTAEQSWSVNDLYSGAEAQAPVYAHGAILEGTTRNPSAIASVFPWTGLSATNPVSFRVGSDATFLSVEQPRILVEGYQPGFTSQACVANAYQCVASTPRDYSAQNSAIPQGVAPWPGCPVVGTKAVFASASLNLPQGHDGIVAILAKTRVQAGDKDGGGSISMGLTIDGVDQGSIAVQEIKQGAGDSQRTLSASVLTGGAQRLKPGAHTIQVYIQTSGDFSHLAVNQDLPILIFD